MTQQINELMRLADEYADCGIYEPASRKRNELRQALEAALKPGGDMCERICLAIEAADAKSMREADYMLDSDDCIRIVREHFAAEPPAQTPVEKS
jgi:hypothetical protein